MAGQLRGLIDIYANTGSVSNNVQTVFKKLYDFLDGHPNTVQVARNGGSGGSTSANINFFDVANPFQSNAWAVWRVIKRGTNATKGYTNNSSRTFDYYIFIQYSPANVAFGSAPGAPALIDAAAQNSSLTAEIGVQYAIGVGGDGYAWAGTTNANGADTKGTVAGVGPVWKNPGSGGTGHFVWPRSNSTGGTHATNQQNCANLAFPANTNPLRAHFLMDDDNFMTLIEDSDAGAYYTQCFVMFDVRTSLSSILPYNMIHLADTIPFASNTDYGTLTGAARGGGIPGDGYGQVRTAIISRIDELNNIFVQPNGYFNTDQFDEMPITIGMNETGGFNGLAGQITFLKECYNVNNLSQSVNKLKTIFGPVAPNSIKMVFPWDGYTIPRNRYDRNGTSF